MSPDNLATDCTAGESLLSIDDAFAAIVGVTRAIAGSETVSLDRAAGRVAAHDVRAASDLPPFDHAAVDGFGLTAADIVKTPPYRLLVAGRLVAGSAGSPRVAPGQSLRLFTGAPVPEDIAAVVMEERCIEGQGAVGITNFVPAGANIRRAGEDVAAGSVIVEAGTRLDARHVAILAAAGVGVVSVRRRVRVALLSTGSELRPVGAPLSFGTIYDSNGPMLRALIASPAIDLVSAQHLDDQPETMIETLRGLSRKADIVVSTGGAAGSETDHTARALIHAGGQAISLRLALRPGKPVVTGRIGETAILGLPGNPVAALVNFLLFGRPLLAARSGAKAIRPRGQAATAAHDLAHTMGRTEFAPARIAGHLPDGRPLVEKIGRGGSARLRPLVLADGLVEIPSSAATVCAGEAVAFHPFEASFTP